MFGKVGARDWRDVSDAEMTKRVMRPITWALSTVARSLHHPIGSGDFFLIKSGPMTT